VRYGIFGRLCVETSLKVTPVSDMMNPSCNRLGIRSVCRPNVVNTSDVIIIWNMCGMSWTPATLSSSETCAECREHRRRYHHLKHVPNVVNTSDVIIIWNMCKISWTPATLSSSKTCACMSWTPATLSSSKTCACMSWTPATLSSSETRACMSWTPGTLSSSETCACMS